MSTKKIYLVNCFSSKVGGGKVILENYLKAVSRNNKENKYFFLVPRKLEYLSFNSSTICVFSFPKFLKIKIFQPVLYFIILPIWIRRKNVDVVINFADIIIPFVKNQVYYFDWAYAIEYSEDDWKKMPQLLRITRKFKVFLIIILIRWSTIIICQTSLMRDGLVSRFGIPEKDILVMHTPVDDVFLKYTEEKKLDYLNYSSSEKLVLFYPSSYSDHKNFDYIIDLFRKITFEQLPVRLLLTIEKKTSKRFWDKVEEYGITGIETIGQVDIAKIAETLTNAHFLFFPSKLESYGLPLMEAMALSKPIIVSDLPYARVLCKNLVNYIDSEKTESAFALIQDIILGGYNIEHYKNEICKNRIKIPTWANFYADLERVSNNIS